MSTENTNESATLNSILQAALDPIAPCTVPFNLDPESGREYITFSVTDRPGEIGDDADGFRVAEVSVYYVCPLAADSLAKRAAVKAACDGIADTLIRETDQSGSYGQVYLYTFQVVI